jgi:hypothetical protein
VLPSVVATVVAVALALAHAPTEETRPAATSRTDRGVDDSTPSAVAWPSNVDPVQSPEDDGTPPVEGEGEDFAAVDDVADEGPGYDPVRDSPEGLQASRRVRGGIALTVIGAAMVIGSIVLGASDPCAPTAGNSCQKDARNRAAWVLGVPGALILGGGITLLTIGLLKRRKLSAGVTAARTGGGLSLSGRF